MSRRRGDSGFTLIEVLVVTIIMGVIVTVISGVVAVILRTQGPLATTTDDARSLRGAVTWLAHDVTAVPPTGFNFSSFASSGCSGGDAGSSLVRLAWTEASTSTVNYIANYRFVDVLVGGRVAAGLREPASMWIGSPWSEYTVIDTPTTFGPS